MLHPVVQRLIAGVVAAFVVTFAVIDATALAYFLANQMSIDILAQVFDILFPAYVVLFLLTWVFATFGPSANRWWALLAGVVIGIAAGFAGLAIKLAILAPGVSLFSDQAMATVAPLLLVFAIATAISVLTLGVWVNAAMRRVVAKRRGGRVALVRVPASNLDAGLVTHVKRKKVNSDKADEQWDAYVATLQSCGFRIVEVAPRDDLADSVFVEDTVAVLGDTAIIASPGAESRREEILDTEKSVRALGLTVQRIVEPGTLDGGDVLKVGKTVYVGRGGRTNAEGIRQFRALAGALGYTVIAVPVTKALHLKSAVTALPDGTVIGYPKLVDDPTIFDRFLPVPEPEGVAVVVVSDDTVVMSSTAKKSIEVVRELGYRVLPVDISEFEKLEGCVTCLSVRVR